MSSTKKLFAFPRMVEDLVRAFVSQLGGSDFSTLQKLSSDYVSDELLERHGDTVWRLRVPGGWAYLLLLLEFQSRDDFYMALRILIYTGLLYQELVRAHGAGGAAGAAADRTLRRRCRSHGRRGTAGRSWGEERLR